ncbi:MAG: DUF2066 domain-containing protein [Spongiibacteraceae bacterium]|jgi:hypothetical protein|nr:DUF2066 domain-containing protein [Spongiibacteraceae bacterium]
MRLFALVICVLLSVTPLHADELANLYQAEVPVSDQSRQALDAAARQGLAQLLVRLTGREEAPQTAGLQTELSNATRYLEQYRYDQNRQEDAETPLVAVLKFAEQPVNALVQGAGLPLWGANRPVVMMWIAKDEIDGRVLVSEFTHPELVAALRAEARQRGLLLRFPLLDLDDLTRISADEVWALDGLALEDASQRYGTVANVGARIIELSDGRWLGSWRLAAGDQRTTLDVEDADRDAFLARGLAAVARGLADQYALQPGAASDSAQLRIALTGISNFERYTAALRYFAELPEVGSVQLLRVTDDRILLGLESQGGVEHLQRMLALDRTLAAATPVAGEADLTYHWRGR